VPIWLLWGFWRFLKKILIYLPDNNNDPKYVLFNNNNVIVFHLFYYLHVWVRFWVSLMQHNLGLGGHFFEQFMSCLMYIFGTDSVSINLFISHLFSFWPGRGEWKISVCKKKCHHPKHEAKFIWSPPKKNTK